MPRSGAYVLSDYPPEHRLRIVCQECEREGAYRVGGLMQRFGDAALPDVLRRLVTCERSAEPGRCYAVFVKGA